jgi:SAM-dependent methyltransferase
MTLGLARTTRAASTMNFESRFGRSAEAYKTFRPDYPPELFGRILATVDPARRNRAMDLGAGTGKATRVLVEHFAEVIAVEPDPLMADKIRETAPRAIIRVEKAEDCQQEPESVDLVNVATALHWMDVPVVIANVERWLRLGGIFAVYGGGLPETPAPIREIVRRELHDHWNAFRDERLRRKEFPQSMVRSATSLRLIEDTKVPYVLPASPRDFAGFWSSTSYGGAYARTLPDPGIYWHELEERIRRAWPDEKFPVDFSPYLLIARKT